MDSDEGKLFIGGLAWDTDEDKLTDYFNQYGDVTQTVIMRDKVTGRPRGFGFVVFSDPSLIDRVLNDKHTIDGRLVEAKRALSREEQQTSNRTGNFNTTRSSGGGGNFKTKKIFVGGLPSTLTEDGFREFFENYGTVTDVVIMYDQNTQRPRGFGFITFDTEDAVDGVLQKNYHELNGKLVEVKRALPKDANPGGGGRGGGYQGYSASGASTNAFDGRIDGSRYVQPQTTAGGFPPYSGYGTPGYGYGAANTGVGYGGYGTYGLGGYGNANTGFGGPAGSYGNPNAPNAGYVSGVPGVLKNTWSNQTPGYGTAGYGAAAPWSTPGGSGVPSAPRGQSPSGASGYGNQGYGYGNYGGSYASYPGGYGTSGSSTNNETAGKEPISGEQGKGTVNEPYDKGNSENPVDSKSDDFLKLSPALGKTTATDTSVESKSGTTGDSAIPIIPLNPASSTLGGEKSSGSSGTTGVTDQTYKETPLDDIKLAGAPGAGPSAPSNVTPAAGDTSATATGSTKSPESHTTETAKHPTSTESQHDSSANKTQPVGGEIDAILNKGTAKTEHSVDDKEAQNPHSKMNDKTIRQTDAAKSGETDESKGLVAENAGHKSESSKSTDPTSPSGEEKSGKKMSALKEKLKDKLHIGSKDK